MEHVGLWNHGFILLVKHQAAHFNALSAFSVGRRGRIDKGRMRSQCGKTLSPVWLAFAPRIEAFDKHYFVWGHILGIVELMLVIRSDGVRFAWVRCSWQLVSIVYPGHCRRKEETKLGNGEVKAFSEIRGTHLELHTPPS